jgi:molybdopterin molybdotransferase
MTGAPLPAGADAVVMVEYTAAAGRSVEIQRSVKSGENFVPRGAEARQGQLLIDRGTRLDHAAIAIAASVGASTLPVFRKPRVAVLSTGDEVVEIGTMPGIRIRIRWRRRSSMQAAKPCGFRSRRTSLRGCER